MNLLISIHGIPIINSLVCTNKKSRIYGTSDQSVSYHMICLICQICQRVRGRVGLPRPHRFESPIGLSRTAGDAVRPSAKCIASRASRTSTGRSNAFSRGSHCIARCAWEADRTLKSVRPCACAWEAVGSRARPLTSDSQTDHMIWESDLRVRSVRPIGLSRTPGDAMRLAVKSVRRARGWQHRPVCVRGRSERPCAWESDRTLPAEAMRLAVKSVRRARGWQHCPALWLAQTDHMTKSVRPRRWEAEFGLSRPLMHSLPLFPVIWLAERESPRPWEAVRGRIRPLIHRNTLKMVKITNFR